MNAGLLSANWLCSPAELIDIDITTNDLSLSLPFKQHALTLANWSLHSPALWLFPMLAGKVRVTNDEDLLVPYECGTK